jgi:hypothetical protein
MVVKVAFAAGSIMGNVQAWNAVSLGGRRKQLYGRGAPVRHCDPAILEGESDKHPKAIEQVLHAAEGPRPVPDIGPVQPCWDAALDLHIYRFPLRMSSRATISEKRMVLA